MRSRVGGGSPERLDEQFRRMRASLGPAAALASQLPGIWGKSRAHPPYSHRNPAEMRRRVEAIALGGLARRANRDHPRDGTPGRAKKPTTAARFTGVPEAGMTIAGSQRLARRHRGFLRSCVVDRTGFRRPAVAMPSRCKRRGYRSMRSVWWQRGNPRVADCRRSMPSARCAGSRPRNAMAAEAKR